MKTSKYNLVVLGIVLYEMVRVNQRMNVLDKLIDTGAITSIIKINKRMNDVEELFEEMVVSVDAVIEQMKRALVDDAFEKIVNNEEGG